MSEGDHDDPADGVMVVSIVEPEPPNQDLAKALLDKISSIPSSSTLYEKKPIDSQGCQMRQDTSNL